MENTLAILTVICIGAALMAAALAFEGINNSIKRKAAEEKGRLDWWEGLSSEEKHLLEQKYNSYFEDEEDTLRT